MGRKKGKEREAETVKKKKSKNVNENNKSTYNMHLCKITYGMEKLFKNYTEKVNYILPQVSGLLFYCDSIISKTFFLMAEGSASLKQH